MSSFPEASTAVTSAAYAFASCTAKVPTAPPAPLITTDRPDRVRPSSRNGLHRERSGRRDGPGLFEGEVGGLQLEPGFRSGRVVRIGAAGAPPLGTGGLRQDPL